ncbi:alpha/beta fold hydrolase [Hoeflea alexandrii]|uniref:alpha/beta fold hydrolase n=1 Tax=Hoeflea alexandrii TaxID=288436 RepID=UPI0022720DC4|nr:alpha/beta hydrolase [Hoeflea alexandrii]MCY0155012.1 alpha/beta hydrolase [Hoeflea alexandrii]
MVETALGPLEVVEFGQGSPVVLLHHGFGTWASLIGLGKLLSDKGRRVIAYSRAGCGKSQARSGFGPGYLHEEGAFVLTALLDALGVDRADLLGHSDGATISLIAAAHHPDRVGRVVAIAPHVFVEQRSVDGVRELASRDSTPEFQARLADRHSNPNAAYNRWRDLWLSDSFRTWSIEPLLKDIQAPLLLLQGTEDEFGTEEHVRRIAVAASCSNSWTMLEGLGHSPHLQDIDAVFDLIAKHLG